VLFFFFFSGADHEDGNSATVSSDGKDYDTNQKKSAGPLVTGSSTNKLARAVVASAAVTVIAVALVAWRRTGVARRRAAMEERDRDVKRQRLKDMVMSDNDEAPSPLGSGEIDETTEETNVDSWFDSLSFRPSQTSPSQRPLLDTKAAVVNHSDFITIAFPPSPPRNRPPSPQSPRRRFLQFSPRRANATTPSSAQYDDTHTTSFVSAATTAATTGPSSPPRQTSCPSSPRQRQALISNSVPVSEWGEWSSPSDTGSSAPPSPRRMPASPRRRHLQNSAAHSQT
jgi:hypothetical protein